MEIGQAVSHQPRLLDVPKTCASLGIGRSTFYELVARGEVEVVHIGRRALVPVDSIDAYIEKLRGSSERTAEAGAGGHRPAPDGAAGLPKYPAAEAAP